MAKYNVVFTIKDKYGHEKELVGGAIDINLEGFTSDDTEALSDALNLDEYVTDQELADALKDIPTVEQVKETVRAEVPVIVEEHPEVHQTISNVVVQHIDNIDTLKYGTFTYPEVEEG